MSTETPFKISVPDAQLTRLASKLELAVFPDELEEAGWDYGVPLEDVKRLVARWKNGYDWRKYEKELNDELPQFTQDIEVQGHGTLNIHYVHKKSEVENAIPLLFVHGWPGSFIEVRKLLPILTEASPDHPSFHVVALGLPGYGFSQAPSKRGFGMSSYAEIGNKLMLSLGYDEYVTQGGDWGLLITRKIAFLYGGKSSKAWHTNFPRCEPPKALWNPISFLQNLVTPFSAAEKAGLERMEWFQKMGRGYYVEQSTQPQTLGYALADSPVGLLAWIYEKLYFWTDSYPWTDDEILTWVSIYLFSRAGPTASLRIYYEIVQGGERDKIMQETPTIPMGVSFFPKELYRPPSRWIHTAGNVVFTAEHARGGHFAAHERPNDLANDLRKMFGKGGPAFGVVTGKTGYGSGANASNARL